MSDFYCQRDLEEKEICSAQCEHCRVYYELMEVKDDIEYIILELHWGGEYKDYKFIEQTITSVDLDEGTIDYNLVFLNNNNSFYKVTYTYLGEGIFDNIQPPSRVIPLQKLITVYE